MKKLEESHIKDKVVKKLAVGEAQTNIAEQVGVDQSTVSRFANEDEIRQLIELEREKLVEVLPDAVQNVKDLVEEMPTIPKDDIKRRELSYKATKDVLKATNVFPSPQYAHNIYNDNSKNFNVSPVVMKAFSRHFETKMVDKPGESSQNWCDNTTENNVDETI